MSASATTVPAAGAGAADARVSGIYRYGAAVNSHDVVKVLAIAAMVVDHAGWLFVDHNVWMRIVGRLAAPLFFFLVGYSGSYRFKLEILLLGVALSTIGFLTSAENGIDALLPLNILLSFVLIKLIMDRFDPAAQTSARLVTVLAILTVISVPAYVATVEFGSLGLCYAMGARLLSRGHPLARFWLATTVAVHFVFSTVEFLLWYAAAPSSVLPFAIPGMAAVFGIVGLILLNYRFRPLDIKPAWIRVPVIYISRYSLQVYFFHLAAFMIVYRLI